MSPLKGLLVKEHIQCHFVLSDDFLSPLSRDHVHLKTLSVHRDNNACFKLCLKKQEEVNKTFGRLAI